MRAVPAEGLAPAAHRGVLQIGGRVVEKIAARAAREATAEAAPDTVLRAPRAGATMHHDHATVNLDVDVPYPGPVVAIARTIRQRVRADVEYLTGMPVVRVDVTVARLTRGGHGKRRVQ
ncbi:Asp23/Gls24 family envelope stress response protein [Embleya sp. NBC_00896]|uniref:Asp23/Gls24 family envelope stress response protein n=1 Tax=Embleya sp. NBC_00896 TaxID=2975961 RepID=UPI0038662DE7|nr:Asp23/Gls24 family envelope stress response protein [Embleya sp. NBC_00896]